jgi:hypothetical protein
MATSGNTSWEQTRDNIIERAFAKFGIPGEGNTLSVSQYSVGSSVLNEVVALANVAGMPLWKRTSETRALSTTNQVYAVSDAMKIAQVILRDIGGGTSYELQNKILYDFNQLPTNNKGVPVNWTFAPSIQGGFISLWPPTSDATTVSTKEIVIVYQKEFDGFFSSGNTPDFPSYWTTALIYRLAVLLAPEYGVPTQDRQELKQEAANYWGAALSYGDDDGSYYFQPESRW